jgi:hypothetical protein
MRLRSRRVKPMVKKILDKCPWIEQSDISTVRGFVDLELLGAAPMADFLEHGALKDGLPRPVIDKIIAIRHAQLTYASALGLTPAARQSIRASGTSAAVDLALAAHRRAEVEATDHPPVEVEATNGTLRDQPMPVRGVLTLRCCSSCATPRTPPGTRHRQSRLRSLASRGLRRFRSRRGPRQPRH